jgi:YfiH family protein
LVERGLIPAELGPGVGAYFTTREFDLATAQGRAGLAGRLGLRLVFANQVHGAAVRWIDQAAAQAADAPTADALATGLDGIGLVIRTADCVPVALAAADRRLVAAVHVGWRGLLAGVLAAAVGELRQAGAGELRAAVGPAICGRCYQIGEDLAERARRGGHLVFQGADGRPRLDVAESAVRQLRAVGVDRLSLVRQCTSESADLFSWRGERATGRQGAVIALARA